MSERWKQFSKGTCAVRFEAANARNLFRGRGHNNVVEKRAKEKQEAEKINGRMKFIRISFLPFSSKKLENFSLFLFFFLFDVYKIIDFTSRFVCESYIESSRMFPDARYSRISLNFCLHASFTLVSTISLLCISVFHPHLFRSKSKTYATKRNETKTREKFASENRWKRFAIESRWRGLVIDSFTDAWYLDNLSRGIQTFQRQFDHDLACKV